MTTELKCGICGGNVHIVHADRALFDHFATPAYKAEALDVKALARAVVVTDVPDGFGYTGAAATEYATSLAREYAAAIKENQT